MLETWSSHLNLTLVRVQFSLRLVLFYPKLRLVFYHELKKKKQKKKKLSPYMTHLKLKSYLDTAVYAYSTARV